METAPPEGATFTPYGPWATLALAVAVMVGSSLAGVALMFLLHGDAMSNGGLNIHYTLLLTLVSFLIGIGVLLKVVEVRAPGRAADYLSLHWVETSQAVRWVALVIAYLLLSMVLEAMLRNAFDIPAPVTSLDGARVGPLLIAAAVIVGPVFEEMMFRGFIMEGLLRTPVGTGGALVISTLLWTLLHSEYDLIGMLIVFGCGIVLGIARLSTGSLLLAMLMHAVFNATSILLSAA
ncbi:MAG: CPBP family intramembrane metalloprotease [Alphaproteobacteria bacterium]|nr:CPBP family intramembrane metalloprotease [Alphaproteobacteria bacterium]